MRGTRSRASGFTLIEVVVTLVLAGALLVLTGLVLAPMVEVSLQARESADILYSSQLAMARLAREFTATSNVVSGASSSITYDTLDSTGASHRRTISWSGSGAPLLLEGSVLLDGVTTFQLSYLDDVASTPVASWGADSTIIQVVLDMGVGGSVYTNRFFPRNIEAGGG
jgi:prepilin-type N-terminal cleavage/methylation domain-containing protein